MISPKTGRSFLYGWGSRSSKSGPHLASHEEKHEQKIPPRCPNSRQVPNLSSWRSRAASGERYLSSSWQTRKTIFNSARGIGKIKNWKRDQAAGKSRGEFRKRGSEFLFRERDLAFRHINDLNNGDCQRAEATHSTRSTAGQDDVDVHPSLSNHNVLPGRPPHSFQSLFHRPGIRQAPHVRSRHRPRSPPIDQLCPLQVFPRLLGMDRRPGLVR